jgi:hypothetical protein
MSLLDVWQPDGSEALALLRHLEIRFGDEFAEDLKTFLHEHRRAEMERLRRVPVFGGE